MESTSELIIHLSLPQWVHLLLLIVMLMMPLHHCADAQSGTSSTTPLGLGLSLRANLKESLAIMLAAFLSAFMFMSFLSLYLRYCARRYGSARNPIIASASELCRRGVNREVIDNCPILVYSKAKDLKIGKGAFECAVCLGEFQEHDKIRLLPKCHHVFHPDCIDAWLVSHVTCPVCRARLSSDCGDNAVVVPIESGAELEEQQEQVVPNLNPNDEQGSADSQVPAHSINVDGETSLPLRSPDPPESPTLTFGKSRSHSTGHLLIEENLDGHTLGFPEHVRNQILGNHSRTPRSAGSDIVMPKAWSSNTAYYRNDGEGSSGCKSDNMKRWMLSGGWGSVMSPKLGGEGDELNGKATVTHRPPV